MSPMSMRMAGDIGHLDEERQDYCQCGKPLAVHEPRLLRRLFSLAPLAPPQGQGRRAGPA
jgi:hypothetical protein